VTDLFEGDDGRLGPQAERDGSTKSIHWNVTDLFEGDDGRLGPQAERDGSTKSIL
jgi:hypothetical protein